jgi:hypothetical protein
LIVEVSLLGAGARFQAQIKNQKSSIDNHQSKLETITMPLPLARDGVSVAAGAARCFGGRWRGPVFR